MVSHSCPCSWAEYSLLWTAQPTLWHEDSLRHYYKLQQASDWYLLKYFCAKSVTRWTHWSCMDNLFIAKIFSDYTKWLKTHRNQANWQDPPGQLHQFWNRKFSEFKESLYPYFLNKPPLTTFISIHTFKDKYVCIVECMHSHFFALDLLTSFFSIGWWLWWFNRSQ